MIKASLTIWQSLMRAIFRLAALDGSLALRRAITRDSQMNPARKAWVNAPLRQPKWELLPSASAKEINLRVRKRKHAQDYGYACHGPSAALAFDTLIKRA